MLELCYYGDAVLRKTCRPVEKFDEDLAALVRDMTETMREEDGAGLAAPQVGKSLRVIVVDATFGEAEPYVLVNPEITESSEEKIQEDEGCLSLPGITLQLTRSARVSVKAFDVKGEPYTIENAEGLLAKALQHEMDHLNGILLIDRISPVQRALLSGKLKKIAGKKE
ncbi:MAG: peptide deformylase [Chitinispirillia bacterium]|nr:peptide deformylase [Chitinispirillia bacterium]MCL2241974.1 peptide deformylase [Chitinispirillia bacterium]